METASTVGELHISHIEGLIFNSNSLNFEWDIDKINLLHFISIIIESNNNLHKAINTMIDIIASTHALKKENSIEANYLYGEDEYLAVEQMKIVYRDLQGREMEDSIKIRSILQYLPFPYHMEWKTLPPAGYRRLKRRVHNSMPTILRFSDIYPYRKVLMNANYEYSLVDTTYQEMEAVKEMFIFEKRVRVKFEQLDTVGKAIALDSTLVPLYESLAEDLREFISKSETETISKDDYLENEKKLLERIQDQKKTLENRNQEYLKNKAMI